MERLRGNNLLANPIEITRKTKRLLREFPQFQKQVQPAMTSMKSPSSAALVIANHYGAKYEEMGFCTKAFADVVNPKTDNTDIGICATEFYVFIDILDDMIDEQLYPSSQKASNIENARLILQGNNSQNTQDANLMAMNVVAQDLNNRVRELSQTTQGIRAFTKRGLETIDALYKETLPQSQKRSLVGLGNVGRKCAYPLMELINCKYGNSLPYISVGNLVGIGNIFDEYWDILKDQKTGKKTFLTMSLPERSISDPEIVVRSIFNIKTHWLASHYIGKLFLQSMRRLDKNGQEDAFSIAAFAQIGVLKRRYDYIKNAVKSIIT